MSSLRGKSSEADIIYNFSKDISASGIRIEGSSFLHVDTLLNMKVTLNNPPKTITALGKVKWIKSFFGGVIFETGLEFVHHQKK